MYAQFLLPRDVTHSHHVQPGCRCPGATCALPLASRRPVSTGSTGLQQCSFPSAGLGLHPHVNQILQPARASPSTPLGTRCMPVPPPAAAHLSRPFIQVHTLACVRPARRLTWRWSFATRMPWWAAPSRRTSCALRPSCTARTCCRGTLLSLVLAQSEGRLWSQKGWVGRL